MNSFPVTAIHQIEITSRCNLACRYCVHPKMSRPKMDMTDEIFTRTLEVVRHFMRKYPGRQRELNLAGIGESTMHPQFIEFLYRAREAVGPRVSLVLATNGLLMTPELAAAMKDAAPDVWVSAHRPEKAGPAAEMLRDVGLFRGLSLDPSMASVDWAGQLKWAVSTPLKGSQCMWVRGGRVMVMADGRVTRCCFDGEAVGVLGHIDDEPDSLRTSPYKLCENCHLDVGVKMPEEVAA